jgi:hypothetical protein
LVSKKEPMKALEKQQKNHYVSRYVSKFAIDLITPRNTQDKIGLRAIHPQKIQVKNCLNIFSDTRKSFYTTALMVPSMRNLRTPSEACEYLRVSITVLYRMEKDGELIPFRYRGKVFYDQKDLDGFLDAHQATKTPFGQISSAEIPKQSTPIAKRSKRHDYFLNPTFGTAVAEIDGDYLEQARSSDNSLRYLGGPLGRERGEK